MNDKKPMESKNADDLIKAKKPGDIQVTEEDLSEVSGGRAGRANLNDITIMKVVDKVSPL
jgi:hypothetical protein